MRRERHFSRGDANETAGKIDHWSTTVAWIDCRIGLHEIFIFRLVHCDITFRRTKNASADRTAVANSVAYDHYGLAKQVRRDVVKVDKWKCGLRVDLNERQVVLVIAGDVMSVVGFAVVCRHVNLRRRARPRADWSRCSRPDR